MSAAAGDTTVIVRLAYDGYIHTSCTWIFVIALLPRASASELLHRRSILDGCRAQYLQALDPERGVAEEHLAQFAALFTERQPLPARADMLSTMRELSHQAGLVAAA